MHNCTKSQNCVNKSLVFLKINQIIHNKEKKCTNLIYNREKVTSYNPAFTKILCMHN